MPGVKAEGDGCAIFGAQPTRRAKNNEFPVEQLLRRPAHAGVLAKSEQIARWLVEKLGRRKGKLSLRARRVGIEVVKDLRLDFEHVLARDSCHFRQASAPTVMWRHRESYFCCSKISRARSNVSASSADLSGRSRTILGKRSAYPLSWRSERIMLLKATSSTMFGSTASKKPRSSIVCSRNHCVIAEISESVNPEYALPIFTSRSPSQTAKV